MAAIGVLLLVTTASGLIFVRTPPFGAHASGDRLARMQQSPQWHNGQFTGPQPLWLPFWEALAATTFDASDTSSPNTALDIAATDTSLLAVPPAQGLSLTWFGHSSTLVEIDGSRVLIDPFWGAQSGPYPLLGAQPFYPPPAALADLGPIDAVVISHDHWDHLDQPTISAMTGWTGTTFVVPLGTGAHLERWNIPAARIRELDWWQSTPVGTLQLTSTPARHTSGRDPLHNDETLWSGWALVGPQHRVWYSGDSGYFPDLAEIGTRLGPFDVTLIESGQYDPAWPDNHLGPELAVQANALVDGKLMIPVHWGLLNLAPHGWTEPAERVRAEAACRNQDYLILVPGRPTEPTADAVATQQQWWPAMPWRTAADAPVNPTLNGDPSQRLDIAACVTDKP